jgi:deaminated glutathione amidase
VKIAAAQTPVSHDLSANIDAIERVMRDAAAEGVRLVSFCEGALSGYAKAQITDWRGFDWQAQRAGLRRIADLCGRLGIFAVVGGAHLLSAEFRPHNSLYVLSATGELLTRYDKRFLSHTEVSDWYTPGTQAVTFDVDGYRFGCALCIEMQFPELFAEYERLGVDAVLFSSYGLGEAFQLRAHAAANCLWIGAATPTQTASEGAVGIIGPDGQWIARCADADLGYSVAVLDRAAPAYDVALHKARPWRAQARAGDIYRATAIPHPRSDDRTQF